MGNFINELFTEDLLKQLKVILGEEYVLVNDDKVEKLSKDFYWYSPVLKKRLDNNRADVVILPGNRDELARCIKACFKAGVPIVPRGGGTGNYGQAIPLYGGVVVDASRLDRIFSLDGVAHVEAGARIGTIEPRAREIGWEMRCLPSTWVKSSIGGFLCGGSGGIGSITWGGINNRDNVKSMTIMTAEEEPRTIKLEGPDNLKALHTYGTTGFLIELEMSLAPKRDYNQVILSHQDWDTLIDFTDAIARDDEIGKRNVSQFEWPIPSYFKPLKKYTLEGHHSSFILVEKGATDEVLERAKKAGVVNPYRKELPDPPKPPYLSDYTWNHTTLWALKNDPSITYLQSGLGNNFRDQIKMLWERFPGELRFHLLWTKGNSKLDRALSRAQEGSDVVVGSIPLVHYTSEERLNEIIEYCDEIGVFTANQHTCILEEGGRHPNIGEKRKLKSEVDPKGLFNPGKMKSYEHNPFALSASS